MHIPLITVDSTKICFTKLKLIKFYLRIMSQEILSELVKFSIKKKKVNKTWIKMLSNNFESHKPRGMDLRKN